MILLPLTPARQPPVKTGPTAGLTEDPAAVLARHADIVAGLATGKPVRTIERETGKARNTVLKIRRMMQS